MDIVQVDTAGGDVAVTLPAASSCIGRQYTIVNIGVGGNVTFTMNDSNQAQGVISGMFASRTIVSNGGSGTGGGYIIVGSS